ncbi:helix-hairpin-helix domain-containing protein [Bacillus weihaiensis]|uniref:Helix-hairpin-helix DNA-binding motif class 1 domain-containing protein n=1 Tax=Bacillus weihaiensis TaxID=1547283 RepID=A0A1L3MPP1_9BACI|nr:helix-hairpin-helix domain-containing protein [Bacillus weihaiensis]APH04313.1 hypothetical protein A9C19_05900 [Bacillus weihaiensis]
MNYFLKNKKWLFIFISILGLAIYGSYYFILGNPNDSSSDIISLDGIDEGSDRNVELGESREEETNAEQALPLVIDIKGEIKVPGVYEVGANERVHHLIEKAGGFTKEADELAVNLAAPLQDGMVLYIPKQGEQPENLYITSALPQNDDEKQKLININTATSEELQTLNGIGPAKAEAIITHREQNGLFQKIEDLLDVSGIGDKSLEKLKEFITVD